MEIREARQTELDSLRDIETEAGAPFADIGMRTIAEAEPPTVSTLARHYREGLAWVAVHRYRLAAYLIADPVDANLHIEQVSVRPAFARRGIGRALIDHAAQIAHARQRNALTLTTFSDVVWNAPYYRRLGFTTVPVHELTTGLAAIREHEIHMGLDRWPRETMIRLL